MGQSVRLTMQFAKMQGVGNDFVVLDAAALPPESDLSLLAVTLCDRHYGVGSDGLLVVGQDAPDAAFSMRMFNPDGSEDMCGNGLRCAALWAARTGWVTAGPEFFVATKKGLKSLEILEIALDACAATVRVDMGIPRFAPPAIPFCGSGDSVVNYPLRVGDAVYPITALNTGSTHTVIFGKTLPDEQTFQRISPRIEHHPLFPERTSVLWATPPDGGVIHTRIWERGVGETLGCGTGACAVGVAALLEGHAPRGCPIQVVSPGGALEITWSGPETPVIMTGPAVFVFQGQRMA